ncbi:hypothetical protein UlMin_029099 [Ulmus minor]
MRTTTMSFSILHGPRCRIYTLANLWGGRFHNWTRTFSSGRKLSDFHIQAIEEGTTRKWTRRRPITTKNEGSNKSTQSIKSSSIGHEIFGGTVSTSTTLNINKEEINQIKKLPYYDIRQELAENKDLASLLTIITFDIETTGLSREHGRIIEIALLDLRGGKDSCFQTLVNPERDITNAYVHGITTDMVSRPEVPRMKELIPILLQYVKSREKPGGHVLWVAHNARSFDVPFLMKEFSRCSTEIPSNWLFLDTLPMAREVAKAGGFSKLKLQALREYYGIPLVGSAHRADSDVACLSLILQRLTYDLKLPLASLVERSFTVQDLINQKKKKSSS